MQSCSEMHQGDASTLTKLGHHVPKRRVDRVTARTWSRRTKAFSVLGLRSEVLAGGDFNSQRGGRGWREKLSSVEVVIEFSSQSTALAEWGMLGVDHWSLAAPQKGSKLTPRSSSAALYALHVKTRATMEPSSLVARCWLRGVAARARLFDPMHDPQSPRLRSHQSCMM